MKVFKNFDFECLQKILILYRSIVLSRPVNLIKYLNENFNKLFSTSNENKNEKQESHHFISKLNSLLWYLFNKRPQNSFTSTIGNSAIHNIDVTVEFLIEIMHKYCLIDSNCLDLVVSACIQLLCFDDIEVSFTCK